MWNGLIVEVSKLKVTNFGFVDADTFFIEFSPGGPGYKVTSATDLVFSNPTDITLTMEPSTNGENRFEFDVSSPKGFFRVETQ